MKLVLCVLAVALAVACASPHVAGGHGVMAPTAASDFTARVVDVVNGTPGVTWTAGENAGVTDMPEELMAKKMGVVWQSAVATTLPRRRFTEEEMVRALGGDGSLPASFDAREKWPNAIGPIRDQGECGSCWAFGAVESAGDRFGIAKKSAAPIVLSAEDLVSCSTWNNGCEGGDPRMAYDYMVNRGVVTEKCYAYELPTCANEPCLNFKPTPPCQGACDKGSGLTWDDDKHFIEKTYYVASVDDIKKELVTNGPVEAAFTVYSDFLSYKSGVYRHVTGRALGGHAVSIIGYGADAKGDYWLVKNSWTTRWGDQGLFKIGVDQCGISDDVVAGIPKIN